MRARERCDKIRFFISKGNYMYKHTHLFTASPLPKEGLFYILTIILLFLKIHIYMSVTVSCHYNQADT